MDFYKIIHYGNEFRAQLELQEARYQSCQQTKKIWQRE